MLINKERANELPEAQLRVYQEQLECVRAGQRFPTGALLAVTTLDPAQVAALQVGHE